LDDKLTVLFSIKTMLFHSKMVPRL